MAKYAGAGSRVVAIIIDHIILFIIAVIIAIPLGLSAGVFALLGGQAAFDAAGFAFFGTFTVLSIILWLIYFSYFESKTGQTPGKSIMGIKVVRMNGKKLTLADAFVRTLLRIIDGIGFYILGLIVIAVSEKKQRIGDMAAQSIVVKA